MILSRILMGTTLLGVLAAVGIGAQGSCAKKAHEKEVFELEQANDELTRENAVCRDRFQSTLEVVDEVKRQLASQNEGLRAIAAANEEYNRILAEGLAEPPKVIYRERLVEGPPADATCEEAVMAMFSRLGEGPP